MTRKIDTGYEGSVPEDFNIPSVGIVDIDRSVFQLFDKRLSFQVEVNSQAKKVPVVFAAGERFALARRRHPIRDRNNAIVLPIISIKRGAIDHSPSQGGYGTAISFRKQQSYVIKRRLSEKDRDFQNIVNKLRIKNQKNVASRKHFQKDTIFPGNDARAGTVATRRQTDNLSFLDDPTGDLLRSDLGQNIFEIITVPYPKFITISYEIVFWTQYMTQMNQLIESMMAQFDGQGHEFFLETVKGYQFVGFVKSPLDADDNFQDFTDEERIIKCSFTMSVPGYIIAPDHPSLRQPTRRFLSAPQVEFGYFDVSTDVKKVDVSPGGTGDINKFILSDTEDLTATGETPNYRGEINARLLDVIENPFTGEKRNTYVKILTRNQRAGETVASSRIVVETETTLDTLE